MNKYLRAIGFTDPPKRKEIYDLIARGISDHPAYRAFTSNEEEENTLLAQYDIETGHDFGIQVCGQFDEDDQFFPEYYFPYLTPSAVSSTEELSVDEKVDGNAFIGIVDDLRLGMVLMFRIQNGIEYLKNLHTSFAPLENTSVSLSALCLEGTVLMPVYKSAQDRQNQAEYKKRKRRLMNAARSGDEDAVRELSFDEMDQYSSLVTLIPESDVFSLVDNYFMPTGAECELYSVLGEIRDCKKARNKITRELIYILTLDCNDLKLRVAINEKDLYGEPGKGRRFRGDLWLQGKINFPVGEEFKM